MRAPQYSRFAVWVALAAGAVLLSSCVSTTPHPQQFRTFFVPPKPDATPEAQTIPQPPPLAVALDANETPSLELSLPSIPRPSDTDFLIKRADDRFAAGKRALQEGRLENARAD